MAPSAPIATTGPLRAWCASTSEWAAPIACQMPFKSGLPWGSRGARYSWADAAAPLARRRHNASADLDRVRRTMKEGVLMRAMRAGWILLGLGLAATVAAAQQTSGGEKPFRTPWGDPDLQGIWTNATLT